jgi:mRNA interferase MazF
MAKTEPIRNEVWLVDFGLAAKVRPAVVMSGDYGETDRALIAVVPHTTTLWGSKLEIIIKASFLKKDGAFLLQGFATVPPSYFVRKLGTLSDLEMDRIEQGLREWLRL